MHICRQRHTNINLRRKKKVKPAPTSNESTADRRAPDACTHLVVGVSARRTLKVIFAIVKGYWILQSSFLASSVENDGWVSEEDHEVTKYPAQDARENPQKRRTLFEGMTLHVQKMEDPSKLVVEGLVELCGGTVSKSLENADYSLALSADAKASGSDKVLPVEMFFDSICSGELPTSLFTDECSPGF